MSVRDVEREGARKSMTRSNVRNSLSMYLYRRDNNIVINLNESNLGDWIILLMK